MPEQKELTAAYRAGQSPVWDMSQERVFMEQLLNLRFNFFMVFFAAVMAGAAGAGQQYERSIILFIGMLLSVLFCLLLARAQWKLNLCLTNLTAVEPTHPYCIIDQEANPKKWWWLPPYFSVRRLMGYIIPPICSVMLAVGFVLSMVGCLKVKT